jgi:phosphoglycolate phosphatase-like HAD superfamily hydrolase
MNSKLLLFDIDGTILSAHGAPKKAMSTVLGRRYSAFNYDQGYDFSGRTDPQIVEHLLEFDDREFSENLVKDILEEFCIELEKEMVNGQKPKIHPGVENLIEDLGNTNSVYLGLVTGNVSKGAKIKLEAAALQEYFAVGGFGDDSKDRNDLPPIAQKRAEKHFNQSFHSNDIWIIGDSKYDIVCAQTNNLRCLAVSTGKTCREKLEAANPEFLVNDLSDSEKIKNILLNS